MNSSPFELDENERTGENKRNRLIIDTQQKGHQHESNQIDRREGGKSQTSVKGLKMNQLKSVYCLDTSNYANNEFVTSPTLAFLCQLLSMPKKMAIKYLKTMHQIFLLSIIEHRIEGKRMKKKYCQLQ